MEKELNIFIVKMRKMNVIYYFKVNIKIIKDGMEKEKNQILKMEMEKVKNII